MKRAPVMMMIMIAAIMVSCNNKSTGDRLEVSGEITNAAGKTVYLEEVPMATMERMIVDSAVIGNTSKYKLTTKAKEASVFVVRLGRDTYPVGYLINDASKITLSADYKSRQDAVPGQYEVENSKASQQMRDFITRFDKELESIRKLSMQMDSLHKQNAPDSVLTPLMNEHTKITDNAKQVSRDALAASENPALSMFILGYYQKAARIPSYLLEGITDEEVKFVVDQLNKKFPEHNGVAAIKTSLDNQQKKQEPNEIASGWVGKPAPEISLPDINGKQVKLSSFRGQYVLVDFWASWCKPCRFENPAVVSAFNKYKDKNFTVLGVSLDQQKEAWIKAIKDDKLTWTHVSDLQFWSSPVVGLYGINGIPFNVLVDPEGKVVAEGLRGSALEAKLAEVLN